MMYCVVETPLISVYLQMSDEYKEKSFTETVTMQHFIVTQFS